MFQRATHEVIVPHADKLVDKTLEIAESERDTVMLARTHGQAAVPTTLGKEMANVAVRMNKEIRKLERAKLTGKFNGAVGNYNAHLYAFPNLNWEKYSREVVEELGLEWNPYSTQINPYEDFIEMFQTYQRLNGVVLDFDQDMWRYISDDWFVQEVVKSETGSSTMAQKVNPIRFENSEGNLIIANGLFESFSRKLPVSRLQRDLSDSTTIRNTGLAQAYSLLAYKNTLRGLGRVSPNHEVINKELNKNWAILTEGVQVYLRTQGRDDAYEIVKNASRGKQIDGESWKEWVESLDVSGEEKEHLKTMTPERYVGLAPELTQRAIEDIHESRKLKDKFEWF